MNPEQNEWQERPAFTFPCANCGNNNAEHDSPSKLCAACRTQFIRYPIPNWIKGFALGIALVLVLALTRLPGQISLGISLERGKAAIEQKNYMTAQEHLEEFTTKMPSATEGQAYLMIASFYNLDFETFENAWEKIVDKRIDDKVLLNEVNSLTNLYDNHFSSDSFAVVLARYDDDAFLVPDTAYEHFLKGRANEIYARFMYAKSLYNKYENSRADSILKKIVHVDPDYADAYFLLSTIKLSEDSFDMALKYCDKAFAINRQSLEGMCLKSRILLKLKRDQEAIAVAKQAFQLNSLEDHIQATLALAYHFTNKPKERDELLQSALKLDTASDGYAHQVLDIINGKETYR